MMQMTGHAYLQVAICSHMSEDCLFWPFAKDRQGYGKVFYQGKTERAHRVAYKLVHGYWPEPNGLHSCDQPSCFNPFHIRSGSHKDNQLEKACKGRQIRGEKHKCSKLTPELVRELRREYPSTSLRKLSVKFGIDRKTCAGIIRRTAWAHIM